VGAAHVRQALALSRGRAARPRDLPPRGGADPGDGAAGPFIATCISASNHHPFSRPSPRSTWSARTRRCGSGSSTPSATPTTSCAS
jgi:hypothetical protein